MPANMLELLSFMYGLMGDDNLDATTNTRKNWSENGMLFDGESQELMFNCMLSQGHGSGRQSEEQ